MFFLLRILNCLNEYAYFVKIAHLFCGREGHPEWMNTLYCLAEQLFSGHFQLIKEVELSVSGRLFIPLWLSSSLSPSWQITISQSQSIFKYSLKCFLFLKK